MDRFYSKAGVLFFIFLQVQCVYAADAPCPTLSASDVNEVIFHGRINNDTYHTLISETGMTAEEIVAKEPKANPYDTYYFMANNKKFNGINYVIGTGSYLAGSAKEARARAKQILLNQKTIFQGSYEASMNGCLYLLIAEASEEIPGYPFKSSYETIILYATQTNEIPIKKTF